MLTFIWGREGQPPASNGGGTAADKGARTSVAIVMVE